MEDKKYLGIDWGEKRIGLALGDEELKLATPFKVVSNLEELLSEISKEEVDILVLGKPFQVYDQKAKINPKFEEFLEALRQETSAKIITLDERLTSKAVSSLNKQIFSKKSHVDKDAGAAMLILQQYFDSC